jgi:Asp-tRNA(Asn)/Glu-tRNA(Gln) amidotransferase A subunit family amidase
MFKRQESAVFVSLPTATQLAAIAVQCGLSLTGLMLVGHQSEDSTNYRATHPFEQASDWKKT